MTKNTFDKTKHKIILVKILKEIYSDPLLRTTLMFKGGTAAYLFYDLPRLSIDLDFDLLKINKGELVLNRLKTILGKFGELLESFEKRNTLFSLLRYKKGSRNIKVEISKRPTRAKPELRNYLGISVVLMRKEDMVAGKLAAFLTRKKLAARDLFDLWFSLKEEWEINEKTVKEKTGLTLKQALNKGVNKIENIKHNQLLQGMGELLNQEQKVWVKNSLKSELLFQLKLYINANNF